MARRIKYNTKKLAKSKKGNQMKKRIRKVQGKAKATGFFYLIAILAISALAIALPIISAPLLSLSGTGVNVELNPMKFFEIFKNIKGDFKGNIISVAIAGLYALMLLTLVINVFRAFGKLGWLFKKKASKTYGFNRNMYAMDDLGKIFSRSFAAIINYHFFIVLLTGNAAKVTIDTMAYVVLGVGFFFHFACGISASKVSLFETENGFHEIKREVGVFASFFRNLLQIAVVAGLIYFFPKFATLRATIEEVIASPSAALKDIKGLIIPAAQLVLMLFTFGMVAYAVGPTEYDLDGAKAKGRKCFLVLALFGLLVAGGAVAAQKVVLKGALDTNAIIVAAIFFVAFVLECMLAKRPCKKDNSDEVDSQDYLTQNAPQKKGDDVDVNVYLSANYGEGLDY